jgi:hypothetical protein
MEDDYPKIFGPKEASTIMSTWTEYQRPHPLGMRGQRKQVSKSFGNRGLQIIR